MTANDPSDLELLLVETDVLWGIDARGRYSEPPLATVAVSSDGIAVSTGPLVRNQVSDQMETAGFAEPPSFVPHDRPAAVDVCRGLLEAEGFRVEVTAGPSYAVETLSPPTISPPLLCSTDGDAGAARPLRPDNWAPGEWDRLTDGTLGEWAMVIDAGQVVSICHTARDTRWGAEAGTWTDPDHQGLGYAAAATAAWADLMGNGCDRPLFYSTSATNQSSQRVAERLGMRPLGWLWKLSGRLPGSI